MKINITERKNGFKRVSYDFSDEKTITDQAAASELTMDSIVKKLEKGILPNFKEGLIYTSDLGVRNLQDLVERSNEVQNTFNALPSEIKQLMGQNIQNFDAVLFDPANEELLLKHGLLVQEKDNHKELIHAINGLKTPPEPQK